MRPLRCAAESGNMEGMRILLQHGANVNAADNYGWTVLGYALVWNYGTDNHTALIRLLKQHGARLNKTAEEFLTPNR